MSMNSKTSTDPVLNSELLDRYRQRSSSLLGRLIEAFLQECPTLFQNVRQSVEQNDYDQVRMNAHTLKSSSHNLGAVRLATVCQDLENAAEARDAAGVAEMVAKLGPEFFEAEQALRGELAREQGLLQPAMA